MKIEGYMEVMAQSEGQVLPNKNGITTSDIMTTGYVDSKKIWLNLENINWIEEKDDFYQRDGHKLYMAVMAGHKRLVIFREL